MKYPKVVAHARKLAMETNRPYVVYQIIGKSLFRQQYEYCAEQDFKIRLETGETAVIRLLTLYPNGTVVQ